MPGAAPVTRAVPGSAGGCGLPAILLYTWSLWQQAVPAGTSAGASLPYTLGTQFTLSQPCTLTGVWWYSYPSAAALPGVCGVWDAAGQVAVAEDAAPFWTDPNGTPATAGDGWVFCSFAGAAVTLATGIPYVAAVFQPASVAWWATITGYWTQGTGQPGSNGISAGPVYAPNTQNAWYGQGCYDSGTGSWAFPGTNPGNGEVFFVDVQVLGPV